MKKFILFIVTMITMLTFASNGEIRVGMEVGYAPFNWYQSTSENGGVEIPSGYAGGYDVEIAKLIAKKMDKELVIVPSDWDSLLGPAINSDKIDLVIAGMSPTAERKNSLDFTNSYYESEMVVVVRKDSKYANAKTLDDFKGAKITAQLNTMHYNLIDQLNGVEKILAMENFPAMTVSLNSGKIDGYIAEKPSALSASATNPNLTYVEFTDGGFIYDRSEVDVAIAVKKGNIELLNEVNEALSGISKEKREDLMVNAINNQPSSDSSQIKELGFFSWVSYILKHYGNRYLQGTLITILLAVVGTTVGSFIGIIVALVNEVKTNNPIYKIIKIFNKVYVNIFRGTPMIVQSMIFYYGLGQVFNINLNPINAAMVIISVNTGAYLSEIFRGGILSIDYGQYEACQALGFNHIQAMKYVILPQAFRNVLPAIGNEFIVNIKDSAVLFAIGVTELYTVSKQISGTNFRYYEVFIITCTIYFILTTVFTRLINYMEKKLDSDGEVIA